MFENEGKRRGQPCSAVAGGYRLIGVAPLFAAWWAYERGQLQFRDLRTYFALHEMASRRCAMRKGRSPRYSLEELGRLVGGTASKTLAASLRRLEKSGLSTWNTSEIMFNEINDLTMIDEDDFKQRLAGITNHRRRIPVPRRTLRWLARASRPVLVATVLGHLFRCVYAKGLLVAAEGSVSASWVAGVFGVDPRNVKRAKAQLRALNWLSSKRSDHWHQQRYGGTVTINLAWRTGEGRVKVGPNVLLKSPPSTRRLDTDLPPPDSNRKLLNGSKNQNPPARPGVQKQHPPELNHVQPEDLHDMRRLLELFGQAQKAGLIGGSDHERLQFVTAAVRARSRANKNPGGFFARLVRRRLWHFATAEEESRAQTLLKRHLYAPKISQAPKAAPPTGVPPADIRLVATLTTELQKRGFTGDPLPLLAARDGRWTRERWDRAMRGWLTPGHPPVQGACSAVPPGCSRISPTPA